MSYFRDVIFSQEWMRSMERTYPPTNMFVMVKKSLKFVSDTSFFKLNRQYSVSSRTNKLSIILNQTSNVDVNCCENLVVYNDTESRQTSESELQNIDVDPNSFQWFQASVLFKGFRDCFVNKVSMSKIW